MFSALAPLLFLALNPALPEAARVHAARIDVENLIPAGKVIHLRWRTRIQVELGKRHGHSPPPGELEEFIGASFYRSIFRVDGLHQPMFIVDDTDKASATQDFEGRIEPVIGTDRALATTWDVIASERWLSADSATVTVFSQTPESTTLMVTTAGDSSALLVVTRDGDLTEVRIPAKRPQRIITYEDFQADGTAVRPRAMTVAGSDTPTPYVLVSRELMSDPHLTPLTPGVDWAWPGGIDQVSLPLSIRPRGGMPVVEADVDGHPGLFLLDTGTPLTVVDATFAKTLRLEEARPIVTFDAGMVPSMSLTQVPKLCFRGACAEPHVVTTAGLGESPFGSALPGMVGILGADVLSKVVVSIDFGAAQVVFAKHAHWTPPKDDVLMASRVFKSLWYVTATVSGQQGTYMVDTGSDEVVTVTHLPGQAGMGSPAEKRLSLGPYMIGTSLDEWPAWGTITVGPFRWEHALLNVIDLTTVNGDDHYSSANGGLGAGFLQHFRVTLDGQEGRVWLKQSTPFGTHEGDCAFGLAPWMSEGSLTVRAVAPGGPAARAGVKSGDRILSINGLSSRNVNLATAFPPCVVGDRVTLTLRRGELTKTVVVKPVAIP